jgi:hypothetical protein
MDVEELERRMRPGAWSEVGFLGKDERLEDVLSADRQILAELGLAPDLLAESLERLLGATRMRWLAFPEGLDEETLRTARAAVDAAEEAFGPVEVIEAWPERVLVGGRLEVSELAFAGFQECPWGPGFANAKLYEPLQLCGSGSTDWSIRDVHRDLEMRGPSLITHLIRAHGFFEGFESPYRVDPRALADLLQVRSRR